jgi:hypothetical protein
MLFTIRTATCCAPGPACIARRPSLTGPAIPARWHRRPLVGLRVDTNGVSNNLVATLRLWSHKAGPEFGAQSQMNPSERIDQLIAKLTDWRGKTFADVRKSILEADREIIEEWKWMGSPVWSRHGIIAVANAHKGKVKLTFAYGAHLPDPDKLFNAGLEGNMRRAIDFFEGDKINERALKNLIRAAVDYNQIKSKKKAPAPIRAKMRKSKKA